MKRQDTHFPVPALGAGMLFFSLAVLGMTVPPAGPEPAWRARAGWFGGGESRLAQAERLERKGRWKSAGKLYQRLAKSAKRPGNQSFAWLRAARCFLRAGKYYTAFNLYKKVVDEYPLYAARSEVLENLRRIGEAFADGRATLFHFKSPGKAVEVYQEILRLAPAGPNAIADTLKLAEYQVQAGQRVEAAATYRDLLKRYPNVQEARLRLASVLLRMARAGDGDGRLRREAREELQRYLENAPNGSDRALAKDLLVLVNQSLANDLVALGRFYDREPHYRPRAARRYLYDVLRKYGDTALAPVAQALLARIEAHPPPPSSSRAEPEEKNGKKKGAAEETAASRELPGGKAHPGNVTPAKPAVEPERPAAPPKGIRWLREQEKIKKWLLPLQDIHTDIEATQ